MDVECCGVRGEGAGKEIDIQPLHQGIIYILELAPIQGLIILVAIVTEQSQEHRLTPHSQSSHGRTQAGGSQVGYGGVCALAER